MANKRRLAFTAITCVKSYHIALAHSTTGSGDIKYITRGHVYYKQADSKERHDPAFMLRQDRQQLLIKNRSSYVRVHLC